MGVRHERAVIAAGVVDEGVDQARRDEARSARGLERVAQALRQLVARGGVEQEFHPQPAVEREEIDVAEACLQPAVARQDDGEDHAGVEVGAGEQAQLVQHVGAHVLRFIHQQDGAKDRGVDVREPGVAERLRAGPAIVGAERHAEEMARAPDKNLRRPLAGA